MQRGFIKAIVAIVVFSVGVTFLLGVFAYTFGLLKVNYGKNGELFLNVRSGVLGNYEEACILNFSSNNIIVCKKVYK